MIIYVNGSINAGKSTVSALLSARVPNTVNIEVDQLRDFAGCLSLEEAIPCCLEDASTLARNWIQRGFNVVVNWPIAAEDHARFARSLEDLQVPLFTFTLAPGLEVARSNRGDRQLTPWERERIIVHYDTGIASPPFGVIIDNSEQTLEETVQWIMNYLSSRTK